jgi:hypothetical protein
MNGGHWTEEDLTDHAYGIGPEDGHLDLCGECQFRWSVIRARRESIVREPAEPDELELAEQRRNIYRRLGREPRPVAARFMPALAAVLMLVLGIFYMSESPKAPPLAPVSASDSQLFSDIYALEQTSEPHVATPMRALFEENR